ncbi:hypothetical protein RRF57_010432 [Xylaria bambusicola]|uniref:ATPase AAA-type core domain-containing protein n=1 Tax=Xylaria bambusicola TaxID=326684 RepID=A0AAN7UUZ9_9PEZI
MHGRKVSETALSDHLRFVVHSPIYLIQLLTKLNQGDLGTTAKDVESALGKSFALANKWDCILLLDEADVFLARRTNKDYKRNGLVAGQFQHSERFSWHS